LPNLPGTPVPNPLTTGLTLKPAPIESTDFRFPINLAAALRLSDARPLIVAAAQAAVWVAEAELTRAKVLWLPTLNVGFDYLRHDGGGPDFNKGLMTAPSVIFFYDGAGLWGTLPTNDAIFLPLAATQTLDSQHWSIQTAKNDALLQTADSYFRVHHYRGMYAGALGTFEGLQQTHRLGNVLFPVNRPQKAVFALQLLNMAFDEYFTTAAEYKRAQFELFHALGYPAREVSSLRTPGEVMPVDTARPSYLPPVGNGPLPATR
jgi:hypothetical protein